MEKTVSIVVDTREHKLIEEFREKETIVEVKQLDLGDIIFEEDGLVKYVIERKTVADLLASIIDGRYHEQKKRLKSGVAKAMYIIEGSGINDTEENKVESVIVSISLDGMSAIRTKGIIETGKVLLKIREKLRKKQVDTNSGYEETIKAVKKKNMTSEMCAIAQLTQIVGISSKTAKEIIGKYGSIAKLVDEFKTNGEQAIKGVQVGEKRKLGEKRSVDIYNALFTETKGVVKQKKKVNKVVKYLEDNGYKKPLFSE